jgi:hypothetical protein
MRLQIITRLRHSQLWICGSRVTLLAVLLIPPSACQAHTSNSNRLSVGVMLPDMHTAVFAKLGRSSARRDSATCDSDRCCAPDHFCSALSFACAPCSLCEFDGDSVGFSCRARCAQPDATGGRGDRTAPRLLWLSLSPGAVDAADARQLVELRFAVQV